MGFEKNLGLTSARQPCGILPLGLVHPTKRTHQGNLWWSFWNLPCSWFRHYRSTVLSFVCYSFFSGYSNSRFSTTFRWLICVHSGFSTQSYGHQCVSSFAIGQHAITYKALSTNVNGIWETPSTVNTAFRTVTGAGDWTILGNGIPIWYQATDQVSSTASTTSSITSSLSPPTSAISTPFPPTSSGLSAGAKAGIGGGVALVAIALAAIIGFILLKRRQRRHHVEIPREELETIEPKHELVSQNGELVHELYSEGAKPTVYELHDNRWRTQWTMSCMVFSLIWNSASFCLGKAIR